MAEETSIQKRETQDMQPEHMRSGRSYVPNVDIVEQDDTLLLMADMPGVRAEDLDISYERGQLTIHGKVAPREAPATASCFLREYGVGDFYRSFRISNYIDNSNIEGELRDGVLTVRLPKSPEVLPRKIELKAS